MSAIPLAQAKAQLSQLIERAAAGEIVQITKHGKPVAQLVSPETAPKKIDFEALKAFTDSMPMQTESAGDFMRRMRDEARY